MLSHDFLIGIPHLINSFLIFILVMSRNKFLIPVPVNSKFLFLWLSGEALR